MLLKGIRIGCMLALGLTLGAYLMGYVWMRQSRSLVDQTGTHRLLAFRDDRAPQWLLYRLYRPCLWCDERLTGLIVVRVPTADDAIRSLGGTP